MRNFRRCSWHQTTVMATAPGALLRGNLSGPQESGVSSVLQLGILACVSLPSKKPVLPECSPGCQVSLSLTAHAGPDCSQCSSRWACLDARLLGFWVSRSRPPPEPQPLRRCREKYLISWFVLHRLLGPHSAPILAPDVWVLRESPGFTLLG